MSVFILVEQSTDQRRPDTKVKITYSESVAQKWVDSPKSGNFTSPCPETEKNYHKTFRYAYEMPPGWRRPSSKKLDDMAWARGSSSRHLSASDILYSIAYSQKLRELSPTKEQTK